MKRRLLHVLLASVFILYTSSAPVAKLDGTASFNGETLIGTADGSATVVGNTTINNATVVGPAFLNVSTGDVLSVPIGSSLDSAQGLIKIGNDGIIEGSNIQGQVTDGVATGVGTVTGNATMNDPTIIGDVNSVNTVLIAGTIRTD